MPKSNAPDPLSTPRAVVDTNLFVRALLKGKKTLPLLEAWKKGRFCLVTSEQLLAELFEVLSRPKFQRYFTVRDIWALGSLIYERAEIVVPDVKIDWCRDPKDNIFLEVAATGRVPFLVTGDNDLKGDEELKKRMYDEYGVRIVSAPEFLRILSERD